MTEEPIAGVNHHGRQLNDGPAHAEVIDGKIVPNETKIDRQHAAFASRPKWRATKADSDGYMAWNGGVIPVHPMTKVSAILRGGYVVGASAFRFDWDHDGPSPDDVVRFKVLG